MVYKDFQMLSHFKKKGQQNDNRPFHRNGYRKNLYKKFQVVAESCTPYGGSNNTFSEHNNGLGNVSINIEEHQSYCTWYENNDSIHELLNLRTFRTNTRDF